MINKKIISSITCCVFMIVSGICISSFANTGSGTNSEAEQHYEKANELYKIADYNNAVIEFKTVIELSPNSAIAQNAKYWIGQLYFETKQFDAAITTFQKLVEEFPDSMVVPSTKTMIERTEQAKRNRSLFEAVKKGDTKQVKQLIADGANIDAKWGDTRTKEEQKNVKAEYFDETPLYRAVLSKNMDMVKLFVEAGADVNAGSWPPLGLALNIKETAIVEYLINHGANVNYPEDWGPLNEAACYSIEMVKLLVERGAKVNGGPSPVIIAGIRSGYREIVEFLIQHGADVNAKDEWNHGFTPLLRAAISGKTEIIKLLLEAGADISAKDDRGQTALHLPLDKRNSSFPQYRLSKDTIEVLLDEGANVNSKDKNGRTPLHLAAESADADIVKLLLDKDADINAKDESGSTALHYASQFGNASAAEVLIANGADINAKDKEGHTPLYAAINRDYKFAEFLIDKGADDTIKTESGKTLLQLAQQRKNIESNVPAMVFDGEPNSTFGLSTACGDVDGDGYDDILIGAGLYDNGRGRVYLFYGGPGIDTTADLILEGENEGDVFGISICCGDIDNDGCEDILIGARGYNESRGRAYLYWGSTRSAMDTTADMLFDGDGEKRSAFGAGQPAVYDIDNDGYDDIIVGAFQADAGKGRTYLYFGNTKELLDTSYDLVFRGKDPKDLLGFKISCGDLDNDSYGDIVIHPSPKGARLFYGGSKSNMGADAGLDLKVKYEGFGPLTNGTVFIDQNRDGYDDFVVGDALYKDGAGRILIFHGKSKGSMNGDPDVILEGQPEDGHFGIQAARGDVDGDDVNDLIISASGSGSLAGRVYIYWGKDLAGPDPKPGRILIGEVPNDGFGTGLACGDVNNDGFDDIIVGAYGHQVGATKGSANEGPHPTDQGRVYLYYGGPRNK